MASQTAPPPEVLTAAFLPYNGPVMIAIDLGWLLFGCYLVQLAHYFNYHVGDDQWLKWLVIATTAAGFLHIGMATAAQWGFLVSGWGLSLAWQVTSWESALTPVINSLYGVLVQCFFAGRIMLLRPGMVGKVLGTTVALTALLAFAASCATTILYLTGTQSALDINSVNVTFRLWTISTVVCDVLIALIMIALLARTRVRTHYSGSKLMITNLIYQSIETGTITAVDMIMCTICYETMNKVNGSYLIWEFASGPLYGNVLLFILNQRATLRKQTNSDVHGMTDFATEGRGVGSRQWSSQSRSGIKVETTVATDYPSTVLNLTPSAHAFNRDREQKDIPY